MALSEQAECRWGLKGGTEEEDRDGRARASGRPHHSELNSHCLQLCNTFFYFVPMV